jgi:hyperosmotically inducible protein
MFTFLVASPQQLEAATRFTGKRSNSLTIRKTIRTVHPPQPISRRQTHRTRAITRGIRKSIMSDKSLSTYAHNVKIITQNGKVTLRGPVRSDEEKANIESKAAAVAGQENVTSRIEVAPGK